MRLPKLKSRKSLSMRSEYLVDVSPKHANKEEADQEFRNQVKESIKVNKTLLRLNSVRDINDNKTEKKVLNYIESNVSLPPDTIIAAKEKDKRETAEREKLILDEKKEEEALYKLDNIRKLIYTVFHYQFEPNSKVDKVEFYERQATLIDKRISTKMRELDALISNKTNSLRMIRLENSKIIDKMSKIKNLVCYLIWKTFLINWERTLFLKDALPPSSAPILMPALINICYKCVSINLKRKYFILLILLLSPFFFKLILLG